VFTHKGLPKTVLFLLELSEHTLHEVLDIHCTTHNTRGQEHTNQGSKSWHACVRLSGVHATTGIMHLGGQLPCHADCIWLEVVSKAEVAKHLKEAVVSGSHTDILQVIGTYALLRGCRPAVLPLSLSCAMCQLSVSHQQHSNTACCACNILQYAACVE